MNKRRLLKLADLLEADASNRGGIKFDLSTVGEATDWEPDYKPTLDCGTTACAMGLAAISGAFKRRGLSYILNEQTIKLTINGRPASYLEAAQRLFGISVDAAHFRFTPGHHYDYADVSKARGERRVAKRIRDFVAGKVGPAL